MGTLFIVSFNEPFDTFSSSVGEEQAKCGFDNGLTDISRNIELFQKLGPTNYDIEEKKEGHLVENIFDSARIET